MKRMIEANQLILHKRLKASGLRTVSSPMVERPCRKEGYRGNHKPRLFHLKGIDTDGRMVEAIGTRDEIRAINYRWKQRGVTNIMCSQDKALSALDEFFFFRSKLEDIQTQCLVDANLIGRLIGNLAEDRAAEAINLVIAWMKQEYFSGPQQSGCL